MKQKIILLLLIILVIESCTKNKIPTTESAELTLEKLANKWNRTLNQQNLDSLNEIYADEVLLYGTVTSKKEVIKYKQLFSKKHPDFQQKLLGEIMITKKSDNEYLVSFSKQSTFNRKTSNVNGYLVFMNFKDQWKITNESDNLTDENIGKIISRKKTCIEIVEEIVTTSKTFHDRTKGLLDAIVKNGGTSYGTILEGSPNPKRDGAIDFSETYDFSLHESYSDRIVTITRFTFNLNEQQLYEYVVEEDKFYAIDFDRNLLIEFNKICQ